jgi:hypothetical protein
MTGHAHGKAKRYYEKRQRYHHAAHFCVHDGPFPVWPSSCVVVVRSDKKTKY